MNFHFLPNAIVKRNLFSTAVYVLLTFLLKGVLKLYLNSEFKYFKTILQL